MQTTAHQAEPKIDDWGDAIEFVTSDTQPVPNFQVSDHMDSKVTPFKPRRRESSFAAVVSDLEVGESASRTHFLNQDMTLADLARDMAEMKAMIRNNAQPAVVAARKRTGGQYRVESGETITQGGNVYLLVIVTRTA